MTRAIALHGIVPTGPEQEARQLATKVNGDRAIRNAPAWRLFDPDERIECIALLLVSGLAAAGIVLSLVVAAISV